MEEENLINPRPNLPNRLFWEVNLKTLNWQTAFKSVIERVLDRGSEEEIDELVRFYGKEKVLDVLKNLPIYLMDHRMDLVCKRFGVKKEDTVCYKRKMARPGRWL
jgi:hypothetical protein